MKESMESLLLKHGVALMICGHIHAYEATKPIGYSGINDPVEIDRRNCQQQQLMVRQ